MSSQVSALPGVDPLAAEVVAALTLADATVATCESLTAGLVASTLASVPGASAVLLGGMVTYDTRIKAHFLETSVEHLEEQGVVSMATARAMAAAARAHTGAGFGLGLTGVAGPARQEGHPAGTVFIALATEEGVRGGGFNFNGSRNEIRSAATQQALTLLRDALPQTR